MVQSQMAQNGRQEQSNHSLCCANYGARPLIPMVGMRDLCRSTHHTTFQAYEPL